MGQYEYKVLPTPRRAKRAKGVKGQPARFAHALTEVINAEAKEGWEYYKSETLPMEMKPGLLKSRIETFQSLLIFRREIAVEDTSPAVAPVVAAVADQVVETPTEVQPKIEPPVMAEAATPETVEIESLQEVDTSSLVDASDLEDTDAVEPVKFDEENVDPLKKMVENHRKAEASE